MWKYNNRIYKKMAAFVILIAFAYTQIDLIKSLTVFSIALIILALRCWWKKSVQYDYLDKYVKSEIILFISSKSPPLWWDGSICFPFGSKILILHQTPRQLLCSVHHVNAKNRIFAVDHPCPKSTSPIISSVIINLHVPSWPQRPEFENCICSLLRAFGRSA